MVLNIGDKVRNLSQNSLDLFRSASVFDLRMINVRKLFRSGRPTVLQRCTNLNFYRATINSDNNVDCAIPMARLCPAIQNVRPWKLGLKLADYTILLY